MPPTPPTAPGYQVGGSISAETVVYVERQADTELYNALSGGEICYVFNSRQMGKSSLLVHTKSRLQQDGFRCCFVDLSRIAGVNLTNEQWFAGVVAELWRGFGLPAGQAMLEWWRGLGDIAPAQKFCRFLDHRLIEAWPEDELVIFFDEVDSVLILPFPAHELFSVIRSLYNQRADEPQLAALRFAFFGVALPADLVSDKQISPFNIGHAIGLEGFTVREASPLASGLTVPGMNPDKLLAAIISWSNGQPFLTQKLCQMIANHCADAPGGDEQQWVDALVRENIIRDWESVDNPEHLRTIRDRMLLDESASIVNLAGYAQLLAADTEELPAEALDDVDRLYLTGMVALDNGVVRPRTRIYRQVFDEKWLEDQLNARRPYAEGLRGWQAEGSESWLLRGEELESAKQWSEGKHLPEIDHQYLSASRELESRTYRDWNKRLQAEISQRKAVESALEKARNEAESANRAKSEFLARVSHEVRTPINSLMGLSHLALQQDMSGISRDYVERIGRTTRYMLGIVNDIVDIGRVERGELTLGSETFYLDEVVDQLIDILAPRLSERDLELQLAFSEVNAPAVIGDADRLEQLLLNLCTNAIKHTETGALKLELHFDDRTSEVMEVRFAVSDSGNGIGETPVSGPVSTGEASVVQPGLGLSLCCHLAELMRGDLSVKSEPGRGCCFTARLRFALADTQEAVPRLATRVGVLGSTGLADLRDSINRLGFEICEAEPGAAGPSCDSVVFDGSDTTLRDALLSSKDACPEVTLLPVLAPGKPLPGEMQDLDIGKILYYPASPRRIRDILADLGSPGSVSRPSLPLFAPGQRVLIVEDDEISRMVVEELLAQAGLEIETAENGAQAVEQILASPPDLILMDIEMPVLNGLAATAEIRRQGETDERLRDLPIVAMTAHALVGDRERFLNTGMNDHITKPLDPAELRRKLAAWLTVAQDAAKTTRPVRDPDVAARVLVVDDQPDSIRVLMEILQPEYTVLVATSGARALQLLQEQNAPDAILLDVQMPEMNGFEVFRALMENPATATIPVIFISASEQDEEFRQGIELGAFDFVAKPVSAALLRNRLERCLTVDN